jgi:hypothetical protein
MTKVLTFKVCIEGLEDKIWRKIEITDRRTVADLAYTILATFDSLAYHLYNIEYKNKVYDSWVCVEDGVYDEEPINATITKLSSLDLKESDTLKMEYDYGSTTYFNITYLGSAELERGKGTHYPYIIDGQGKGMLDDMCDFELKEIVEDIEKKGYSDHYYTPGYERTMKYDYRDYDIKFDNTLLKGTILEIKYGYEVGE